ncbi:active regulator of SIRT1 isoform X1 [Manis pentadactyla]|uniref:active regulator of SIRT1 isoform X1 n=1 Tax=Manis pentadactyla TaxID=143292 RepID=UPI00255CB256|nr:active regulator of SIRT1 isoform X1 [Manis pentadactyla]
MSAALLRRGLELLGAPEGEGAFPGRPSAGWSAAGAVGRSPKAPCAAPGQAKPSRAPVKRTRKAKATQAQKLRNSAKGKVPKSALAEFQKRECRSYLGENLKFMMSTRRKVAESVTQQDPATRCAAGLAQGSPGAGARGWLEWRWASGLFAVERPVTGPLGATPQGVGFQALINVDPRALCVLRSNLRVSLISSGTMGPSLTRIFSEVLIALGQL